MKVGIFSPYLDTLGGGERYIFSVAEFFLRNGDKVDIYGAKNLTSDKIKERFNIDISLANFINSDKNTFGYDLFFFLSDGSIPFSFAKKNILHLQVPFNNNYKTFANKIKLLRFSHIVCNSNFTKNFIDKTYGIVSEVLYPPVDVDSFKPAKKENIILSVGRFFAPSHPKKQEIMIKAFKDMYKKIPGWKFVLAGGVFKGSEVELVKLKELTGNLPIELIGDPDFKNIKDLYSQAKIYWHAAGFGEDLKNNPEKAEHFGISTVEAMASGCIPIVFSGGGQKEIIQDGKNGFLWKNIEDLSSLTLKVISNKGLQDKITQNVVMDSNKYSKERFYESFKKIISS